MGCTHEKYTTTRTRGFSGPVCDPEFENRAAHGCVTDTEMCVQCGARRYVNINQCYREEGPWGVDRAERRRIAEKAQARVQKLCTQLPKPIRVHNQAGRTATVTLERTGGAVIIYDDRLPEEDVVVWAAVPESWRDLAVKLRNAVLQAEEAEHDID